MAEKTTCEICNRTFKDIDGLMSHNKAKHSESLSKEKKSLPVKKIRNWTISIMIIGLIIWGVIALLPNSGGLPPTDMQGHREVNPPSHILKDPMPLAVQKHMLEHADGIEKGKGGVIINYNCEDYICEESLVENLESFAEDYNYVYVAPFKGMEAKIALTKLGRIQTFEQYDSESIRTFIE